MDERTRLLSRIESQAQIVRDNRKAGNRDMVAIRQLYRYRGELRRLDAPKAQFLSEDQKALLRSLLADSEVAA